MQDKILYTDHKVWQ